MNNEPGNYELIRQIVRELSGRQSISFLEIGTCEGGSAAAAFEQTGKIHLAVLIDTWGTECGGSGRGTPDHVVCRLQTEMAKVIIITGDSRTVLPSLTHKFDFIFIDGDHSKEGCLADMKNSMRLWAEKGVMLVDDLDNASHTYLRAAVESFAREYGLSFKSHAVHCGVAELRRK